MKEINAWFHIPCRKMFQDVAMLKIQLRFGSMSLVKFIHRNEKLLALITWIPTNIYAM